VPAMRGVHKARDSPAEDQVAVETPLPPSGNSGRSGLRRDGDGDPAATREPPATSAGTALWGDAGLRARRDGGSGGDKGQELGVPAAAPPRPGTEGTSGAAPAATLPQTPGLTRGPVALNPSSPVSQIRPTLTIPDCRVSCCPLLLLGSASHSDRS
jgi:hypothetical protein